jgi:uncharacterized Fe-S cluster protein YjdI
MAEEQTEGGSAPPLPEQRNRAPDGLTREYAGEGIRVQWYAERCIHSAECIRALPGAFDPRSRPWIDLHGAEADAVADAVLRCPTGALHYSRTDGGPPEPVPEEMTLEAVPGGPYYVRGPALVALEGGGGVRQDTRMALCRCGRSVHMPFCDNSHRALRIRL